MSLVKTPNNKNLIQQKIHSRFTPKRNEYRFHKKMCSRIFIVALFIIIGNINQRVCKQVMEDFYNGILLTNQKTQILDAS